MGNQCVHRSRDDRTNKDKCQQALQLNLPHTPQATTAHKTGKQNVADEGLHIAKSNRQTIIDLNETELHCLICKEKYNTSDRMPVILCQEEHTICQNCKQMLLATKVQRYKVCPLCKRILNRDEMKVNQVLKSRVS